MTQPAQTAQARASQGFTLIELLMVIIIIAVLAMIAIPKFSQTQQQAREASVRNTIQQLQVVQDSFKQRVGRYAGVADTGELAWSPPTSVTMDTMLGDKRGWWVVFSQNEDALRCGYGTGQFHASVGWLTTADTVICRR